MGEKTNFITITESPRYILMRNLSFESIYFKILINIQMSLKFMKISDFTIQNCMLESI